MRRDENASPRCVFFAIHIYYMGCRRWAYNPCGQSGNVDNVKPTLNRILPQKRNVQIFRNVQFWCQKSAKKSLWKICRIGKSAYLCIRFRKLNTTDREQRSEKFESKIFQKFFAKNLEVQKKSLPLQSALKDKWRGRRLRSNTNNMFFEVLKQLNTFKNIQGF